jgi:hypothetical protein
MQKQMEKITPRPSEPVQIGLQELKGTIDVRFGDRAKGFEEMRKAAAREAALVYTEPPSYPRPVVEGMGNVAIAVGDFKTAAEAFRDAPEREPSAAPLGLPMRSPDSATRRRHAPRAQGRKGVGQG